MDARPPERWLILADDLTGAADCAIAFARQGAQALVAWGPHASDSEVLALDADSRRLSPAEAAARHAALLMAHHRPGIGMFKKIDSTLRGQPAAELAETVRVMRGRGHRGLAIVAPAFPDTGRTTSGGVIHLHGQRLEETPLWARDHSYPTADLAAVLRQAGLRVAHANLATLRAGAEAVVRNALDSDIDALVCDAETAKDLALIAAVTRPFAAQVFWVGSGGLAQALARRGEGVPVVMPVDVTGGILFVVGSIAEASRAAAAMLGADETVTTIAILPETLRAGPEDAAWQAAADIAATLGAGQDVLVEIAADAASADLSQGAILARQLARLLQPAAPHIGALFATGGETALALLDALGVTGIRMIEEIEPGVPLGLTRGALTVPVITKAGAFGDGGTLHRCLSHLRRLRPEIAS
ncbi:four-carbon acid sugar kinase family protein [Acidisoma cladoniae]|jgi:uncharacterized protein YgbK (DUF1537 family)|uniref:four-carbon acid sugar kinase family protein n=1 Tax=Acidisoma cladoniae TaxID=3040935 RepID=UPI00254D2771|nr:four-carbon acid sugar kinase family protein [Acidisoma sp. PAMC 29798]